MGITEALKVQRINAQICTYNHFTYSVKEVWTVLRYLRKQEKKAQNTNGDQEHSVSYNPCEDHQCLCNCRQAG